jgi:hypothetical protein
MDPITTSIVVAASQLGETVVRDAYAGLKALIVRKFGKGSEVEKAVEAVEARPDSAGRQQTLDEELAAAPAARDPELLAAVAALQAALEKLAAAPGGGARTVVRQQAGDHATQIGQVHGDVRIGRP